MSPSPPTVPGAPPTWPDPAIFPPRGLTDAEAALHPRPWWRVASDGVPLAVLSCDPPERDRPRAVVVVLHGVQSHAGWYHGLGRRLAAAGFAAQFPDRRGSGANPTDRGHAPSARRLIRDVVETVTATRIDGVPTILAGISWGGKLALTAAAEPDATPSGPASIAGVALLCPGLTPRVGVSTAERLGIVAAMLTGRARTKRFPIPLADPALFTAEPDAQAFIAADPLSLRDGTAGLMAASFLLDRRLRRVPERLEVPALLMLAGRDRIVDNQRTTVYFERLGSPIREILVERDAHHTLEFEPDPSRYVHRLIDWIDAMVVPTPRAGFVNPDDSARVGSPEAPAMSDPDKRERRIEKRVIKRRGNQRVRRMLKRALAEDPEAANEVEIGYGRFATAPLNGIDRDATRRRDPTDAT